MSWAELLVKIVNPCSEMNNLLSMSDKENSHSSIGQERGVTNLIISQTKYVFYALYPKILEKQSDIMVFLTRPCVSNQVA
jgi:hypothetical protein